MLEDTRLAALLRAGRYDEARILVDLRLDRRTSPRDEWLREQAVNPA